MPSYTNSVAQATREVLVEATRVVDLLRDPRTTVDWDLFQTQATRVAVSSAAAAAWLTTELDLAHDTQRRAAGDDPTPALARRTDVPDVGALIAKWRAAGYHHGYQLVYPLHCADLTCTYRVPRYLAAGIEIDTSGYMTLVDIVTSEISKLEQLIRGGSEPRAAVSADPLPSPKRLLTTTLDTASEMASAHGPQYAVLICRNCLDRPWNDDGSVEAARLNAIYQVLFDSDHPRPHEMTDEQATALLSLIRTLASD